MAVFRSGSLRWSWVSRNAQGDTATFQEYSISGVLKRGAWGSVRFGETAIEFSESRGVPIAVKLTATTPAAGMKLPTNITIDLTAAPGTFQLEWYRPYDGVTEYSGTVRGGAARILTAPWQGYDVVLRLTLTAP